MKTCSAVADLERLDGTMTETDVDKAEVLNTFFTSVFTLENLENIPTFENRLHDTELTDFLITNEEVENIFKTLKTTKPPGPDGLHPRLLVELTDELVEPFQKIFTKSLAEGTLPQNWKEGNITPIFKKGLKHLPGNYRPVSLISVACKMMEKLARNEVMAHMIRNNLLSSLQHGAVHGRSCTTQLLEVLDKWTEAIEQEDSVDAIYLDFAKAFDTVPHQRLLVKLAGYGIGGKVLKWIAAFLEGRRQRVLVNGSNSSWSPVTSGIPQGSVLGPMLFVCYINDMPDVVDSPIHMFADDTKIFRQMTAQSDQVTLQIDLRQLEAWTKKWQLRFNEEKCKVMHLGQYNHHPL